MANIRRRRNSLVSQPSRSTSIPFALSRVFLRDERGSGTVMLVEVGGGTTSVVIATNGVPQFLRIIPRAVASTSRRPWRRAWRFPSRQAETFKRTIGLSSVPVEPQHQRALETVYELTGELLTSIRNTLTYFVNTRPAAAADSNPPQRRGLRSPGLRPGATGVHSAPCPARGSFERFASRASSMKPRCAGEGPSAAVALGLAMAAAA